MGFEVAVSVVVPSHARPERLGSLLDALGEQLLDAGGEAIVVHDYDAQTAHDVLDQHPLQRTGRLRHVAIPPGRGSPAYQRNVGWRTARGPLIAFTDDDCRPDTGWLRALLDAERAAPGAIVQGATRPDPAEVDALSAPHVRTLHIDPVGPYVQTCNVLYPRALLERLGGFDERAITGEDVDLSLRARREGAAIVAAPTALVFHAVDRHTLLEIIRLNFKWQHLAYLVDKHPKFRRELVLGVFWERAHLWAALAGAGLAMGVRWRLALLLGLPYARSAARRRYLVRRSWLLAGCDVPGQFARQFAEVVGLAVGSIRYRTFVL